MNNLMKQTMLVGACALFWAACGSSDGGSPDANITPTDVKFGDTVLVVVVNPVINDANDSSVATPGTARAGITLTTDNDISATTDAAGIAVLGPLTPGTRTITLSGSELSGEFTLAIADGELHEIALAADAERAEIMVEIDYKTNQIVELTAAMTPQQVNDALKVSDSVVFFGGGTYTGDIDFSGSKVTLFGEGVLGGEVILDGNVTISGSDSRIRGTHITGNLTIPASGVGLSFSQVDGSTQSESSDATLLSNALCGGATLTGSGLIALDNAGTAPITACP